MAQKTDLYSILSSFANKNNSPFIDPEAFIIFLEKYAKKSAEEHSEWLKWTENTRTTFWSELTLMAEEGKCELFHDTPNGRIYMPNYYQKYVEEYYIDIENNVDFPFPSEGSMGITIPENQLLSIEAGTEFRDYLESSKSSSPSIIRITFPDDLPSALVLLSHIPQRLIETCLLKIRNYLEAYGNKEYTLSKLSYQLMGKEAILRDMLNKIINRPLDYYTAIAEGGEFSCVFWSHLCNLIRIDVEKKVDRISGDIAALQAAYILETINSFYKTRALKARDKELAFKTLERNLGKAPFLYTMDDIIRFTSPQGFPLLKQYSKEELVEWLENYINDSKDNKLPKLLIFRGPKYERFYVLKSRLLFLCNRLVNEARDKVKNDITDHWQRLLRNYQKEPSMENDKEFDKALIRHTGNVCPMLNSILEDPKLPLVCDELEQSKELPPACQIYSRGVSIPYSTLFFIQRKDILSDARFNLPLWYSMPFIVFIVSLFNKPGNIKGEKTKTRSKDEFLSDEINLDRSRELVNAARAIERAIVPNDQTLDSYLEVLKGRWVRVLDKKAGENLVEDVNTLVRDNLRQTLRINKRYKINYENLRQLAANIVNSTPSLNVLNTRNALRTYIELYLIKLVENLNNNLSINEAP